MKTSKKPNDKNQKPLPEEPPCKKTKLRSHEPDLRVTIQYNEDGTEHRKTYDMYAQVLARQSKFVDTMLSVEMREKETREVVLHDVLPEVFELALKLLEDPVAVLHMTETDAMKVVAFYDQFEFPEGLTLCDKVLQKYLQKWVPQTEPPDNLEFLVDAMAASLQFGLEHTKEEAKSFLFTKFLVVQQHHFGMEMFTVDQVRRLQPLLAEYAKTRGGFLDFERDEITNPLFPKYFVEKMAHQHDGKIVKAIVVCGTQSTANGKYLCESGKLFEQREVRPTSWNRRLGQCFVKKAGSTKEWCIVCRYIPGDNEVVLWKSPHSQNLLCPPKGPWKLVESDGTTALRNLYATARPSIKYIKYDEK